MQEKARKARREAIELKEGEGSGRGDNITTRVQPMAANK